MGETREPISVCTITDDAYAPYAAVMLASLFAHHEKGEVRAFVLTGGLSDTNREKLVETGARFANALSCRTVEPGLLSELSRAWTHSYIPLDAFYKFWIAEVLSELPRVLYLDGDIIVTGDLRELYYTDFDGALAAAVQTYDEPAWGLSLAERFGLSLTHRYFNSGVMLLDLARWRTEGIARQMSERALEKQAADEIVFNLVLCDRCKTLHPRYNVGPHLSWFADRLYVPGHYLFPAAAYAEAAERPAIVHFCGPTKPWQYRTIHPQKHLFSEYLAMTPYAGMAPEGLSVRNVALKPFNHLRYCWWRRAVVRNAAGFLKSRS